MFDLGYIESAEYDEARDAPVTAKIHGLATEAEAPYVAEMVRAHMEATYGDVAYTAGYKVYTTLDSRLQHAANAALREALVEYDVRHGYRGSELRAASGEDARSPEEVLADVPGLRGLLPAASRRSTSTWSPPTHGTPAGSSSRSRAWSGHAPTSTRTHRGKKPEVGRRGREGGRRYPRAAHRERLGLLSASKVEGALVSLNPNDGAIVALTGGFDFYRSKFNRVTQAERQPGSSFKPFIYSAALEHGYTPASIINDAPVVFEDPSLKSAWRPENYGGKFFGPTRLANGAVQVAQSRLDSAPARYRHRLCPRPHRQVRVRCGAPASGPLARARQRCVDAPRGRGRIHGARQRRIWRQTLLH